MKKIIPILILLTSTAFAKKFVDSKLLCIPEKMITCDMEDNTCFKDEKPETLSAIEVDLKKMKYSYCKRSGKECVRAGDLLLNNLDTLFDLNQVVLTNKDWHTMTFKIDGKKGKFATSRISGGFQDSSIKIPVQISVITMTGSCIEK